MKKLSFLLFIIIAFSCKKEIQDYSSDSFSTGVSSDAVVHAPFEFTYSVNQDFASYCTPEIIRITGDINVKMNYIQKEDRYHSNTTMRYVNIRGVGLTSGMIYMLIGQESNIVNTKNGGQTVISTQGRTTWKSPGAGKGTTLVVFLNTQWVVNGQGTLVLVKENFTLECK